MRFGTQARCHFGKTGNAFFTLGLASITKNGRQWVPKLSARVQFLCARYIFRFGKYKINRFYHTGIAGYQMTDLRPITNRSSSSSKHTYQPGVDVDNIRLLSVRVRAVHWVLVELVQCKNQSVFLNSSTDFTSWNRSKVSYISCVTFKDSSILFQILFWVRGWPLNDFLSFFLQHLVYFSSRSISRLYPHMTVFMHFFGLRK